MSSLNILNHVLQKFEFNSLLIKEFDNWYLLLRSKQITLGSSILINKYHSSTFSNLSPNAFKELPIVLKEVETSLSTVFKYDKLNYLMLMMHDPTVHFHIIPRYSMAKNFDGVDFIDKGWPDMPDLNFLNSCDKLCKQKIIDKIKSTLL